MVDRDQLDKFEEIFQTSLSESMNRDRWDSPSEDIWEEIAPNIEVRKRTDPKRYAFYAFTFLGLLVSSYAVVFGPSNMLSLVGLSDEDHRPFRKNNTDFVAIDETMYGRTGLSDSDFLKEQPIISSGIQLFIRDETNSLLVDNLNQLHPFSFGKQKYVNTLKKNNLAFDYNFYKNLNSPIQTNTPVTRIAAKQHVSNTIQITPEKRGSIPSFFPESKKGLTLTNFGFWSQSNLFQDSYRASTIGAFDSNHYAFAFGGKTEFSLNNKLSLEAGLGISRIQYSNTFNTSINHDASKDQLVRGAVVSNYNTSISSGYGSMNTNVNLLRTSDALDDSVIPISGNATQRLTQLTVPVNLKMAVAETDKLKISPVIGAQANVLLQDKASLNSLSANHVAFEDNNSQLSSNSISGLQPLSVDLNIGVDFNVDLNSNKELEISPFYSRSLNSNFELNGVSNSTSSVGISLGVSINK